MTANFHTHTYRCNHADGADRDYVETAIKSGFKVLGFSDHNPIPQFGESGYYSHFRMRPAQMQEYAESVLALKEEYKKDIEILLGFEMEYYPALFEETLHLLGQCPYDYLILGQHCVGNEYDTFAWPSRPTDDATALETYVAQTVEGMKTGVFSYLAHPDLFYFTGDDRTYCEKMMPIIETARKLDMPLECNLLGVRDRRQYPAERFWRLAAQHGVKVILGCDAHTPSGLCDPKNDAAYPLLAACGVTNIVEDFR